MSTDNLAASLNQASATSPGWSSSHFAGARGRIYYCRRGATDSPPGPASANSPARATVVIAHGLGEHLGRYTCLAQDLTDAGYNVYALDHHGHGRSAGPRAQIWIADAIADLDHLVTLATDTNPERSVILFGHSLGGLIALRYAIAHQDRLRGLALSSPAAALDAGPVSAFAAKLIGKRFPSLPATKIDSATLSHDPAVVAGYDEDPLNYHGAVPAGTALQMLQSIETLAADVTRITLPTLLMYGSEDRLCPPRGAIMLSQHLGAQDLTVKRFEGFYHELLNEFGRKQVLATLLDWLGDHTAVTPSSDAPVTDS